MPNLPISQLPAATPLSGSELFVTVQNGVTKYTTLANISTASFQANSFYGSFYHTASMLNPGVGTINSMSLSTTDFANGVSISGSSKDKIKIANSGYYDIQFSAQLDKTSAGADFITYIWIRKNEVDIPTSNTAVTTLGGSNAKTVAAWNWFVSSSIDDYFQIMWASAEPNARIQYTASAAYGPAVPSVIVTVNRVG
jgi:hypothetical protein